MAFRKCLDRQTSLVYVYIPNIYRKRHGLCYP